MHVVWEDVSTLVSAWVSSFAASAAAADASALLADAARAARPNPKIEWLEGILEMITLTPTCARARVLQSLRQPHEQRPSLIHTHHVVLRSRYRRHHRVRR